MLKLHILHQYLIEAEPRNTRFQAQPGNEVWDALPPDDREFILTPPWRREPLIPLFVP